MPALCAPPPLLALDHRDIVWLNPDHAPCIEWDSSMCRENTRGAAVRELMTKAFRGPLMPAQQQHVLSELDNDNRVVYHCGLSPERLPQLVRYSFAGVPSSHSPPRPSRRWRTTP